MLRVLRVLRVFRVFRVFRVSLRAGDDAEVGGGGEEIIARA